MSSKRSQHLTGWFDNLRGKKEIKKLERRNKLGARLQEDLLTLHSMPKNMPKRLSIPMPNDDLMSLSWSSPGLLLIVGRGGWGRKGGGRFATIMTFVTGGLP